MNPPEKHPKPASNGNPAYPSLDEREKLVAENKKKPEHVQKLPADKLPPPAEEKKPLTRRGKRLR